MPMKHEVDLSGMLDQVHKHIPIETIMELRLKGLSYEKIGKILGCTSENVRGRLKKVAYEIETLPHFKKHRADIYSIYEHRFLRSISNADLMKSSAKDKVVAAAILYDKRRLEEGKSTSNVMYADLVKLEAQKLEELRLLREGRPEIEEKPGIRLLPQKEEDDG